jgi:hypothetical protein
MLDAPEYPLSNQTATGSVGIFDPHLRCRIRTRGRGFRALGAKSAIEIRYLGTRSRQWETFNYNESNIIENGFLNEFKNAQANLYANLAAGRLDASLKPTFAYFGPGTGTTPLPIYLAYFSGIPTSRGGQCASAPECAALYNSANWASSSFVNPLGLYNSNPFTPAGTSSTSSLSGDPARQANGIAAGLPANFFRANRHARRRERHGNRGFTAQLDAAPVPPPSSGGLQFDANYASAGPSNRRTTRSACRASPAYRATKATSRTRSRRRACGCHSDKDRWVPCARPVALINGWQLSGTNASRRPSLRPRQRGVIGMSEDVQQLFRFARGDIAYAWPQDIIDETIKASRQRHDADRLRRAQPATGRYSRRRTVLTASRPSTTATATAVRELIVTGPIIERRSERAREAQQPRRYSSASRVQRLQSRDLVPTRRRVPTLYADRGVATRSGTMQIGTRPGKRLHGGAIGAARPPSRRPTSTQLLFGTEVRSSKFEVRRYRPPGSPRSRSNTSGICSCPFTQTGRTPKRARSRST